MKEIKAFVHKHRIAAVIEALKATNILPRNASDDAQNINVATVQSLLKAVDATELLQRALAKAEEFAALPQAAFAQTKRQLRSVAIEAIEAALAGEEPLLDNWLSRETVAAAAAVLAGKG